MFNNLYTIIENSANKVVIQLADKNHPIFKAHFPTFAILPGFIQIDIIAHILNDDIVSIKQSKFISHILPLDTITYNIEKKENKTSIKLFKDLKKVSEIRYES
ncbi:MAG: hypothetical protein U9R16_04315 [Campylobacterota bacterium]|nr:hypothetical protein [Campylobacterota bacterium]